MSENDSTIFGDKSFGFELADIVAARDAAAENARVHAEMLADENEQARRVAERDKEEAAKEAEFFEVHDDEAILGFLKQVFERGKELEADGLPELEVVLTVHTEMPVTSLIGGILLERQTWGYCLYQKGIAAALRSKEQ
jgi:SpoVK/Ycf46/Vps4 family AAA+-type ATPase